MKYLDLPVHGDSCEGEYAGGDGDGLDVVRELAHLLAQRPLVVDQVVELEGHVEGGDEQVADRQGP